MQSRHLNSKVNSILLISFSFLSSFAASGAMPMIASSLESSELNNFVGFFPFFLSILIGQFLVFKFSLIRESKDILGWLCLSFAFSIFLLEHVLLNYSGQILMVSMVAVRALEGLIVGVALPLVFESVLGSELTKSKDLSLAALNISYIAGFVFGLPMSEIWFVSQISFLKFCGLLLLLIPLLIFFFRLSEQKKVDTEDPKDSGDRSNWSVGFYLSFIAKLFYGYFISYVIYQEDIFPFPLLWVTIFLASISTMGQILSSQMTRNISGRVLELYAPTAFGIALLAMAFYPDFTVLTAVIFFHSVVYFLAMKKASHNPKSAKDFAFINGVSDPGIVLGSALPLLDQYLSFSIIGFFAIGFFLLFWIRPVSISRAESLHPFVDPISLIKVFLKHKSPFLVSDPTDFKNFYWSYTTARECKRINFLFAGDMIFSGLNVQFNRETENWIRSHDLRVLNLEAPFADKQSQLSDELLFSSQEAYRLFNKKKLFNCLTSVNNHSMDYGLESFLATKEILNKEGVSHVSNKGQEIEIDGFKIFIFAKTFGLNLPWRHRYLRNQIINLDLLVNSDVVRDRLKEEIKGYKEECDFLIFSYHWGYESESVPSKEQREAFEFLYEAGVDILFGHHSHIPQPAGFSEDFKNICLYSCGNLDVPMHGIHPVYNLTALYSVEYDRVNRRVVGLETRFFMKTNDGYVPVEGPEHDFVSEHSLSPI